MTVVTDTSPWRRGETDKMIDLTVDVQAAVAKHAFAKVTLWQRGNNKKTSSAGEGSCRLWRR
jgi:hypothetical protein